MRLSICFVALSENRVPPNSKPHGLSSCMRRVIQPMGVSAYPRLSPMFSVQMCIYIHTHTHIHIHVCTSTYLHIPHISHVSWFKRRSVGHHERLLHFLHRRTPLRSENRTTEILGEALPKEGVYGQVVGWQSSCNWCDFTRIRFLGWTVKYTWRGFLWCKKSGTFEFWVDKAYRLRWMGSWTDRNRDLANNNEEQTNQNGSR